jgi:hypothetical protein
MSRQDFYPTIGTEVFPDPGPSSKTMDCDSKSQSKSQSEGGGDPAETTIPVGTQTVTGPGPALAISRRRPMRRGGHNSPDSIFERDGAQTAGASSNPITFGDVLSHYLQQRSAAPKRAMSPKTSRSYD